MFLISVYPNQAKSVRQGTKKYEFRKSLSKKMVNKILRGKYLLVYETKPIRAMTMIWEIEQAYQENINALWNKFGNASGISQEYFYQYYGSRSIGIALKIKRSITLKNPISLERAKAYIPSFSPPQRLFSLDNEKLKPLLFIVNKTIQNI